MKYTLLASMLLGATLTIGFRNHANAQEAATRDEAKVMVDAAVEHVKKVGPDQAFKDFSDKSNKNWQKKDLYVFAYSMEGANEKLIGKNLIEVKDPNGKPLIQELRATAQKGGGWVEYDWPHPQTKKVESKVSFVRKMGNYEGFVGAGVYR